MPNPWLKKNPFMSLWLSTAHAVAGKAHNQAVASARRQSQAAITQAAQQVMSFWTGMTPAAAKPRARRKAKR